MKTKHSRIAVLFLSLSMAVIPVIAKTSNCLWRVRSASGTLYLQGSVHILKAEHYPLPKAIETAYRDSAKLVLELDMNEMASPEIQQLILSRAQLKNGQTLETKLNPEVYANLAAEMAKTGMPEAGFQTFEPWFVMTTMTLLKMQSLGFHAHHGLDQYFFNKAQQDAKPIEGLEHAKFQIELLASLANENPNEFVARALTELKLLEQDSEKAFQAWASGDINALGQLINNSFSEYPELFKTFIIDRNKQWIDKLEILLSESEPSMVIVGAGHLPGPEGLLELLKQNGYELEQL
jgi:uncharacterized protein YbaP (TraB family)